MAESPVASGGFTQRPIVTDGPLRYTPPLYVTAQQAAEITRAAPSSSRVSQKGPFRHGFHVALDVISCGLWLPVHVLLATMN